MSTQPGVCNSIAGPAAKSAQAPVFMARPQNTAGLKATARRQTIKTFRKFLDSFEEELDLYGLGPKDNELAQTWFRQLRQAVRKFRDESWRTSDVGVLLMLDIAAAWDEWLVRQKFGAAVNRIHETLTRTFKGAIKAWRTYSVQIQLPDSPQAAPKLHADAPENTPETVGHEVKETPHGEIRRLD